PDRQLLGNDIGDVAQRTDRPAHDLVFVADRGGCGLCAHSPAQAGARSGLRLRAGSGAARSASARFCQASFWFTSTTSTAVTLYSGQLVAQSEFSVVTTLALVSGKWNVVYTTPGAIFSDTFARSTVSPARLVSPTQSPSLMPRISASCGWISSTSSACQMTLRVRR